MKNWVARVVMKRFQGWSSGKTITLSWSALARNFVGRGNLGAKHAHWVL